MTTPKSAEDFGAALKQLEAEVREQVGLRVRCLHLLLRGRGLVLKGRADSFHAKQIAQSVLLTATSIPLVANEIEVRCHQLN